MVLLQIPRFQNTRDGGGISVPSSNSTAASRPPRAEGTPSARCCKAYAGSRVRGRLSERCGHAACPVLYACMHAAVDQRHIRSKSSDGCDRTARRPAWHGMAWPCASVCLVPAIGSPGVAQRQFTNARDCANTLSYPQHPGSPYERKANSLIRSRARKVPGLLQQTRQGLPAPCSWARQTCSTGAVYKSSLTSRPSLPDLQAERQASSLRQCAPARQTQSCACCNLIA